MLRHARCLVIYQGTGSHQQKSLKEELLQHTDHQLNRPSEEEYFDINNRANINTRHAKVHEVIAIKETLTQRIKM